MLLKHPGVPVHDHTNDSASLELLQIMVGGYIEMVQVPELNLKGIAVVVNDMGNDKVPNISVGGMLLKGPIVFVGISGPDTVTLTDDQARFIDAWLNTVQHARV